MTIPLTAAPGYDYSAALAYQWKHSTAIVIDGSGGASSGGGTVSGASSASMAITGLALSDFGTYTVKVSNSCGFVTSSASSLGSACPADHNLNSSLEVIDIFSYLTDWFALCTSSSSTCTGSADFNGVDGVTVQDIFDFLAAWFAGCS